MVKFMPHDSHMTKTDAYPLSFVQRVDACVHMQCGIVYAQREGLKVAFCGRKHPGEYLLRYVAKGFPGAHGSRHLYNMMGGRVYEVDFISAAPASSADMPADVIRLELPSRSSDPGLKVHMAVPVECQDMIKLALDCLPWSCLSWSVHRGLRDILLASGKPTMGSFRNDLAALLKRTVVDNPGALDQVGWNPTFVRASMGDMTASAVMEGSGDSGDLVRVVTDIARVHLGHTKLDQRFDELDDVQFWRLPEKDRKLDAAGVVALTKFFVLEWSIETDYQLYHQLPLSVNFG